MGRVRCEMVLVVTGTFSSQERKNSPYFRQTHGVPCTRFLFSTYVLPAPTLFGLVPPTACCPQTCAMRVVSCPWPLAIVLDLWRVASFLRSSFHNTYPPPPPLACPAFLWPVPGQPVPGTVLVAAGCVSAHGKDDCGVYRPVQALALSWEKATNKKEGEKERRKEGEEERKKDVTCRKPPLASRPFASHAIAVSLSSSFFSPPPRPIDEPSAAAPTRGTNCSGSDRSAR